VIENTLNEFEGLVILVSHDRKFMEELCNNYLVLEGEGKWATYANIDQWLKQQFGSGGAATLASNFERATDSDVKSASELEKNNSKDKSDDKIKKPKLSYKDKQALETIDADIEKAEADLIKITEELERFKDFENKQAFNQKIAEVTAAQATVDKFYAIWEDLESKK
jgi:ABC transport system ATP-binding/permease protein